MQMAMGNDALKVSMFRFVDVLASLSQPDDILRHFREYMEDRPAGTTLPFPIRWALALGKPGTPQGRWIAYVIQASARKMATRFIAGDDPAEVLQRAADLNAHGLQFTLDLLGEATVSEHEAEVYLQRYLELIQFARREVQQWPNDSNRVARSPLVNVSVKLTGLSSRFFPIAPQFAIDQVAPRLRKLFRTAREHGAFVNIDMEHHDLKDQTLRTFCQILSEEEFRDWPDVGLAMQAYLPETERDLSTLKDWAQWRGTSVWVRLVKGAYWDFEVVTARQRQWPIPVFTQKWQSDASFERCSDLLLGCRTWLRPAFASHNVRSLAHALAMAEAMQIDRRDLEFQMLFGMADSLKYAVQSLNCNVRVYAPFGRLMPGMAYLVRRLLENTSNTSFLKTAASSHRDIDPLLTSPGSQNRSACSIGAPR